MRLFGSKKPQSLIRLTWGGKGEVTKAFREEVNAGGGKPASIQKVYRFRDEMDFVLAAEDLRRALEKDPSRFIWWYTLADYQTQLGWIEEALDSAEKAFEVAPDDPRASYALGSTFRILTWANYSDEEVTALRESLGRTFRNQLGEFPPLPSRLRATLDRLDMTVDQAASEAVKYLTKTLDLGVRKNEEHFVQSHIASIRREFAVTGAELDISD